MPRFVILEHDHPELHWDLMLEAGAVLQTWRLASAPGRVLCEIEATELPDHRLMYLDYEGPVSNERGTVKRWDAGDFTEEPGSLPDVRKLILHGARVHGRACLERVNAGSWRFRWLQE